MSHERVVRRGVTEAEFTRLRQEHELRPAHPGPSRLLRAALEADEELIIAEGGYRYKASAPLSSWMVDVTPLR